MKKNRLALGLDLSTQGIAAVVVDIDSREKVGELSLDFCRDARLNSYGIRSEDYILLPKEKGEANQPAELYFAAIDAICGDIRSVVDPGEIVIINSSGQQHGHVYLNHDAGTAFNHLRSEKSVNTNLARILRAALAYDRAPIWMTSNTAEQAEHIRKFAGGKEQVIRLSGSDVPLRFTGVIMRRIAQLHPEIYSKTENIQLISSLIPAILTGDAKAPIDHGNGCGTALMDYKRKYWSSILISAAAAGLEGGERVFRSKLPELATPDAQVGTIAAYFQKKYGFASSCIVLAGSGDNPQSKVLVNGDLLSLGTSIVNMAATDGKTMDMNGYANAMYDGVGRPFMFGCRTNGAMVWDNLRAMYGLKKEEYGTSEEALRKAPIAQNMVFWQPRSESFPVSGTIELTRAGDFEANLSNDYAGLIETTLAAVYHHSKSFSRVTAAPLFVTGGAAASPEILRRVAAIWQKLVIPIEEGGAALGAAVAAACTFLKTQKEMISPGNFIGPGLQARGEPVQPRDEDIKAFHSPGGYMERFAVEEERVVSGAINKIQETITKQNSNLKNQN
jgi:xylulokinase